MRAGLHWILRVGLAGLIASALGCQSPVPPAANAAAPRAEASADALVPFASPEGLARLSRSTAKVDFPALANQFEAQTNPAFCGPTSATILLNTLRPPNASRARYTQDSVIGAGDKTRAQVLGEPVTINGKTVRDFGYQIRQFDQMLRAHGVATTLVIVDDALPAQRIRADLVDNLARDGDYVLVNYRRELVGQRGGGHISPLGAYDAASDSFLVLDVNPAAAGWVWMPAATLIKGMRSFDTVENRGYVLVAGPLSSTSLPSGSVK